MKESNNSYYDIEIGIIVIMLVLFLILSIFNGKDEKIVSIIGINIKKNEVSI